MRFSILPRLGFVLLPLFILGASAADPTDSAFKAPTLTGPVVDEVGVLNQGQLSELTTELRALSESGRAQVAVLITNSLQGLDIADYGIRLAEAWKIGTKSKEHLDRGVIFIVAPNDRRMRIEVGYGLEGEIPDATASQILERVVKPRFRENRMSDGISEGTHILVKLARGEGADTALPAASAPRDRGRTMNPVAALIGAIILLVLFIVGLFRQLPLALGAGVLIGSQFFSSLAIGVGIAFVLNLLSRIFFRAGPGSGSGGGFFGGFGGGGSSSSW